MSQKDFSDPSDGIFYFTAEGILIVDEDGFIIRANPSANRMMGYAEGALINKKVETLIPGRHGNKHEIYRKDFHSKKSNSRPMGKGRDLFAVRSDGSEFPVEVSLSPFTKDGENFVIAFIIDISARKKTEEQLIEYKNDLEKEVEERTLDLRNTIERLEKTKNELDQALKREQDLGVMKSRFVSMASHEFRTPLATIMSSLSLVEKYGNRNEIENRNRHIERIKLAVKNLTEILNDFLSLNRLEEGKVVSKIEEFDINMLVEDVHQQMLPITKIYQIILIDVQGNSLIKSDPKLITNILINLISNSIKFSAEDGKIGVNVLAEDKMLTIKVKDEGIGIPVAEHKHVFERFYRMSNAGEIQGTGLGLSIVKHYVTLMKGNITFESSENKGTEFVVSLPLVS